MLHQADSVRDYMRETAPLGAALTSTSVEEPTPEEEEEEEEEGEDEDGSNTHLLANSIEFKILTRLCLQLLMGKTTNKKIQMRKTIP